MLIGQYGLLPCQAVELIGTKTDKNDKDSYGKIIETSGCLKSPIGELNLTMLSDTDAHVKNIDSYYAAMGRKNINISMLNCGINDICQLPNINESTYESFRLYPLHILIGHGLNDGLHLCFNHTIYFNQTFDFIGGRGVNVLLLRSGTLEPYKMAHFDTYNEDSSSFEIFLEDIPLNDILIMATFDEASLKLMPSTRELLAKNFGSGMIQNFQYRASWYIMAQKTEKSGSFASIEHMEYPNTRTAWAFRLEFATCFYHHIDSQLYQLVNRDQRDFFSMFVPLMVPIYLDYLPNINTDKSSWCNERGNLVINASYDWENNFCSDYQIYDTIPSAPLIKPELAYHPIYDVPILVFTKSEDISMLRMTLETISYQPGIKNHLITVILISSATRKNTFNECNDSYHHNARIEKLCNLFGAKYHYYEGLDFEKWTGCDDPYLDWSVMNGFIQGYGIIVKPYTVLSPDYIHFMSRAYDIISNSSKLDTIKITNRISIVSAYNPIGFNYLSSLPRELYLVSFSPTLLQGSYLVNINLLGTNHNNYNGLSMKILAGSLVIYPDVSRVLHFQLSKSGMEYQNIPTLSINQDPFIWINEIEHFSSLLVYTNYIHRLRYSAIIYTFSMEQLGNDVLYSEICQQLKTHHTTNVILIEVSEKKEFHKILSCFTDYKISQTPFDTLDIPCFQGVVRFSNGQCQYLLMDQSSPFHSKNL